MSASYTEISMLGGGAAAAEGLPSPGSGDACKRWPSSWQVAFNRDKRASGRLLHSFSFISSLPLGSLSLTNLCSLILFDAFLFQLLLVPFTLSSATDGAAHGQSMWISLTTRGCCH
jgi:hypothetical protein